MSAARRRAGLVAVVAGVVLLPWFWLIEMVSTAAAVAAR